MRSVALDLGSKKIAFCEVSNSKVVARAMVPRLEALMDFLGPHTAPATVAIEACREAWVIHDQLTAWGHTVLLVDTTRVKQLGIGQHGRKNDRIDAEVLARAVERGLIPCAHVLSPERRQLRALLSVRRALVETRAQYVTTIRGLARAHGKKIPTCKTGIFVTRFNEADLGEPLQTLCAPLLGTLQAVDQELAKNELAVQTYAETDGMLRFLMTAPGVSVVVAAMFISVVDDAHRFRHAHQVQSYLGLVPLEDTTGGGDKRRLGSITKQGNGYLRSLLIQSGWSILRSPHADPLKAWGLAIAERRGRKSIAAVAVARRLAGLLWALWRDGTVYDPEQLGQHSSAGIVKEAQSTQLRAKAIARAGKKAKLFANRRRNQQQPSTVKNM
jgi:transposase